MFHLLYLTYMQKYLIKQIVIWNQMGGGGSSNSNNNKDTLTNTNMHTNTCCYSVHPHPSKCKIAFSKNNKWSSHDQYVTKKHYKRQIIIHSFCVCIIKWGDNFGDPIPIPNMVLKVVHNSAWRKCFALRLINLSLCTPMWKNFTTFQVQRHNPKKGLPKPRAYTNMFLFSYQFILHIMRVSHKN